MLIGKGLNLAIYDRDVSRARLIGANREYIEREIPHIWSLMRGTVQEVVQHAEVVLIGNSAPEFREIEPCLRDGQTVIDLVRSFEPAALARGSYQAIC
jgi:GDP-mannose 6-dehydrogenase